MRTPLVAIIGRPNVGKSTLFNRMIGERKAIVEDFPGVTRDRNYHYVDRYEFPFTLVDTGGFEVNPQDPLQGAVVAQTRAAAEEADLIIAVFDAVAGVRPEDHDLLNMLRRFKKPVVYVVNKIDGIEHRIKVAEFYELGVDELLDVSALHGRRVRELVEAMLRSLPNYEVLKQHQQEVVARRQLEAEAAQRSVPAELFQDEDEEPENEESSAETSEEPLADEPLGDDFDGRFAPVFIPGESELTESAYDKQFRHRSMPARVSFDEAFETDLGDGELADEEPAIIPADPIEEIRFALVGRPNVGKSTLFNHLLGEERAIVSPIAGTTRDALDQRFDRRGQTYLLVDTAGLRKKGKIEEELERYSALRSLSAISESDVVVLLIDALEGPTEQDSKLAGLAHDQGRGMVIAVNKWDLVEKDHRTAHEFKERVKEAFKFAPYAPQLFISAQSGRRCETLLETVRKIAYSRQQRVSTNRLNRTLTRELRRVPPPRYRGVPVKVYFASQVDQAPPLFVFVVNFPKGVHFSYQRYLKNLIREQFDFVGTDIKLKFTSRRKLTP